MDNGRKRGQRIQWVRFHLMLAVDLYTSHSLFTKFDVSKKVEKRLRVVRKEEKKQAGFWSSAFLLDFIGWIRRRAIHTGEKASCL